MRKPDDFRTWIEINKKAIAHNYHVFRKLLNRQTKFLAVVKSNAYGHNLLEFAMEMAKLGADWLGVDSFVEARSLRSVGVKIPVLVLGYTLPTFYNKARESGVSITISSFAQLEKLLAEKRLKPARASMHAGGKILKIHIKVDAGMHRQGFQLEEADQLLNILTAKPEIFFVEGLYTHFAEAKNPRAGDSTRRQIGEFKKWIKKFHAAGLRPIVHAAATGGALLYHDLPAARLPRRGQALGRAAQAGAHFDMVRIGIGCYGLWPSREAEQFLGRTITLKPVLSWKAVVSEVKLVKKGERVGYDFTERLARDTKLAVVPVGYWHGIPRLCSSKGRVLIHGKTARIVGRVSMDMIVVDVTDIPNVKMGDEATLIGRNGKEEIEAGEIANYAGTTHYEIVTQLNPLIKKFYC